MAEADDDGSLTRRGFVMTSLMTGLTLATTRVQAQAIQTDSDGLDVAEVQIPTDDGQLPAYYARPLGDGPFPIVLVIEEIFGVHGYIQDVCRRLAKQGYLAVATEYYARLGDLSRMSDVTTILAQVIFRAPDARVMADADASAAWAAQNKGDADRLAVIGFCRGGRETWLYAAHNPRLRAAVVWYGEMSQPTSLIQPQNPIDVADQLKCPLLGLYGAQDENIQMADVEAAAAKARAAGKNVEIVVYPNAGHGFFADYRPSYRPDDAADSWRRALAFLKANGM